MNKGVYGLVIFLNKNSEILISKKRLNFKKGYYIYVGSALNNLDKRIERHKSGNKKLRWNIDYFLNYSKIISVKKFLTNKKIECLLSNKINKLADNSVRGFGCNDCRCRSHLYYFSKNPEKLIKEINF